jgi:hypothetical protein
MPGAEISIPALSLTTRTNFAGEYHLGGIVPGRYLAIATAAGYRSVGDSVTVGAGSASFHDFVLARTAIVLDSVVSKAAAPPPKHISPSLTGFEERRLSGGGGYFVVDSVLRKEEDRPLADIIRMHVPGVDMAHVGQSRVYLTSGRGPFTLRQNGVCYPDVYLDGVRVTPLPDPQNSALIAVDITQFVSSEVTAMEFYPGGASLPVQFSRTSSGCGALALWTREK